MAVLRQPFVRWEKACGAKWCHRSLAANWLWEALGEAVPELGQRRRGR
jgi:hypothetical protein